MFEKIQSKVRLTNGLVITLICILFAGLSPLHAQPPDSCGVTWSPIQQISVQGQNTVGPQLTSHDSFVFALWLEHGDDTLAYCASSDYGNSWGVPRKLYIQYFGTFRLAASGKRIYAVYSSGTITEETTRVISTTDFGNTWDGPRVVVPGILISFAVYGDSLFVNFSSDQIGGRRIARSTDRGFSWEILPTPILFRQMIATPHGLHGVRDEPVAGSRLDILYRRSLDFGLSWDSVQILSTVDQFHSQSAKIAADSVGNVYVVWNDAKFGGVFSGAILFRRSTNNGATWIPEMRLSPRINAVFPYVAVRGTSVHVVWDSYSPTPPEHSFYTISQNQGESWCGPSIFTDSLLGGGSPKVSAGQYAYIVWARRTEVYFRRATTSVTSAPALDLTPTDGFEVSRAWPNPFNPVTQLEYKINRSTHVLVTVYNILGQKVRTLLDANQPAGTYRVIWDGADDKYVAAASGVYRIIIATEKERKTQSIILLK